MQRVAFDLVCLVLPGSNRDATPRLAHIAGARLPVIHPGHIFIIGNQRGYELVFRMSARGQQSCTSRPDARKNYKLPSFHLIQRQLAVADVTIGADILLPMTIDAPPHGVFHLTANLMGLGDLTMAGRTVHLGADMRLVREVRVGGVTEEIDSGPGRLLVRFGIGSQLLNLRAFSLHRLVTCHADRGVRHGRVRRLSRVVVTKRAIEAGAILLGDVLPVIECNRLHRCFRFGGRADPEDTRQNDYQDQ